MIIVRLFGGLGNQMFQYATGRALSISHGVPLFLDAGSFKEHGQHQGFELNRLFHAQSEVASNDMVREFIGWRGSKFIRRFMSSSLLRNMFRGRIVVEPYFHYWPGIQQVSPPCYLSGYWQSAHYFNPIESVLRDDFHFQQPLAGRNLELSKRIATQHAVSLHVRRGDYFSNPKAFATHGVCSVSYYQSAVDYVAHRIKEPHFYVFSDDPEWVRSNMRMDHPHTFVDHNRGADSYNDMRLMSICRHHIVANSSFSWWGAWLNTNSKKIVVTPKKWFVNNTNTKDLIPEHWVSL
jgi:hypothetical protein